MSHIEAQDLHPGDQVKFQEETYNVINTTYDPEREKVALWMRPAEGFGADKLIGIDPKFSFELIDKSFFM